MGYKFGTGIPVTLEGGLYNGSGLTNQKEWHKEVNYSAKAQFLFAKKLNVQEGNFNKAKFAMFAVANLIAHAVAWIVVAPVLDILIYAEPVKKVFAQGAFAAVSNIITAVVVGGLLILAYTKTIAKKGSLDKE